MLETALNGSQCLVSAVPHLKKLFVPKVFYPLVSVGTDSINFVFSVSGLLVLALVVGFQLKLSLAALPAAIAIVAAYNLGMVLVYGVGTVHFRDLPHILQVMYPAFFYAVPIFYPMSAIAPQYHWVFLLNPFYWFINLFRRIIHDGSYPSFSESCIPSVLAILALLAGFSLLLAKDRTLIYRL